MYSATTYLKARNTYNNLYIKYLIDWFIATKNRKSKCLYTRIPGVFACTIVVRGYLHLYIKRLWILFTCVIYTCITPTGYINKSNDTTLLYGTIQIKI